MGMLPWNAFRLFCVGMMENTIAIVYVAKLVMGSNDS